MENDELIRRAEDLALRCEKSATVTHTAFLTPAEQYALTNWAKFHPDCRLLLYGGHPECERKAAFFLPYYMDEQELEPAEYFRVLCAKSCFGAPSHRDYMGAVLGMGIKREWIGDIWVEGDKATVFCLPSVEQHLLDSLERVGRYVVRTTKLELNLVEAPVRQVLKITFSVKSMRLDAVCAGMFGLSRTKAEELISLGNASLNYSQCVKCSAAVREGDIISVRGCGKGKVGAEGGLSRKGRLFVTAEIYR